MKHMGRKEIAVSSAILLIGLIIPSMRASAGQPTCFGRAATIVGTAKDDRLVGTRRADVIVGLQGIDVVFGGRGNDLICGVGGYDWLHGGPGDDKLDGGLYADTLWGGPGDDLVVGGPTPGSHDPLNASPDAFDEARFTSATRGVRASLVTGRATGDGSDTLVRVDQLFGSRYDDVLVGGDTFNVLVGLGGDDHLSLGRMCCELAVGGPGDDILEGGRGDHELLDGGSGDDVLNGGAPRDTPWPDVADYSTFFSEIGGRGASRPVHVDLVAGTATGQGHDTLIGIGGAFGGDNDDVLLGDARNNWLFGMGGDDVLRARAGRVWEVLAGGDGDDALFGGTGPGVDAAEYGAVYSADPAPVHVDLSQGTATSPGSIGTDTLSSINLVGGTALNDTLIGDDGPNILRSGPGDDLLQGLAGDDFLHGAEGRDTVDGGDGDDTCIGRRGHMTRSRLVALATCLLTGITAAVVATPTAATATSGRGKAEGAVAFENRSSFQTVTSVQQISRSTYRQCQGDTEAEPMVAMDPNDPDVLVAVFQQARCDFGLPLGAGYAASHDGGETWVHGRLPHLHGVSDPVAAIGPDGSAYAQVLRFDCCPREDSVILERSNDGGLTFGRPHFPQVLVETKYAADKDWIAVDTFPGSPHYGRVYSVWSQVRPRWWAKAPIVMKYSNDRGRTWSGLHNVSGFGTSATGAFPLVQPNGDLTVLYFQFIACAEETCTRIRLMSRTSTDGGRTFEEAVPVARWISTTFILSPTALRGLRTSAWGPLPGAALDPVTGYLYATWQDGRFRSDGLDDIVISRSTDGGQSWSGVRRVNVDETDDQVEHFNAAVAAHSGFVHVTYSTRGYPGGPARYVRQRYLVSEDDGLHFGGELQIGQASDVKCAAVSFFDDRQYKFFGDYVGIAASADAAHVVWDRSFDCADHRYHQTTWSATVVRSGSA